MADTTPDRVALARMVRELDNQLKSNINTIFKPVIAHPDHVRQYFTAYTEYLARALAFPELPERDLFQRRAQTTLTIHRDNLGDLAARIGELAGALEASYSGVVKDLENARAEITRLNDLLTKLREECDSLKTRIQDLEALGGKRPIS